MPVFLDPAFIDEWLDPSTEGGEELLEEVAAVGEEVATSVENYEVDRAVGNVRNNSPELIAPV
jgi:putative SOS response-associated peptidase YedK